MSYIENPKLKGSGILGAIPQTGKCPIGCEDCFFQSGRSFLEPLEENLPNIPPVEITKNKVVRMNDGNDSNNDRKLVMEVASQYENVFYNTAIPKDLEGFGAPVVLTLNPGKATDTYICLLKDPIPSNLMFVRIRVNTWNTSLVDEAVEYYTKRKVPVVLTFMAYYTETIPKGHEQYYSFQTRTLNSYWVITQDAWDIITKRYVENNLVYTCGKDASTHSCARCGNCLREYYATKEKIKKR